MKKTLLLVALVSSASAFSQITITEANLVGAGDQVIQNSDTLPSVSNPIAGANQSWDYSSLIAHTEDTTSFVAPGWLPNSAEFPSATLAVGGEGEFYLEKDATGLRSLGVVADFFGTGTPLVLAIDPYETIIQFPANYNDAYSENFSQRISLDGATVGLPVDSVVVISNSTKDVSIDSWGSMTTPFGTFEVIGTSETLITIDSTYSYILGTETFVNSESDTSYNRSYWSNDPNAKFPVMEFVLDDSGNVNSATWLKETPSLGLIHLEEVNPIVLPNPASDIISINATAGEVREVVMYDLNGSQVASKTIVASHAHMDISHLSKGVYVLKAFNDNGDLVLAEQVVKL